MTSSSAAFTAGGPCRRSRSAAGGVPALAVVAWMLLAWPAAAQHHAFVDALVELTAALPGTYGDEGEPARSALERLERGLAEWDQTLREYEANVEAIRPAATPTRVIEMHRTMGMFYLARGRIDDAVRELSAAAARAPEPLFQLFLGLAHEAAGRPAAALAAYAAAAAQAPADPVAAYMHADASLRSGAPVPAAALETLTVAAGRIAAGEYAADPDPFLVTDLYPDTATGSPTFVTWWFADLLKSIERREYAAALAQARSAAGRDPLLGTPSPALRRGAAALRSGRVADAIEQFEEAVRAAPGSEAHRMLGVAYWLSAEPARSVGHLEQAARLDPTNERARLILARVLEDAGEPARAEQILRQIVEDIPSSATAHYRLGRLHAAASRTEDAVRAYEAAAAIGALAGEAPVLIDIGELHRRELDAARAEAAFARAVRLRPNDAVAHRERGRALLDLEQPEAALVELAAALLIDPDDYLSYLAIGQIHLDAGRFAPAASMLTRAVAVDPDKPEAHYALASVMARSGRGEDAMGHLVTFARLQEKAFEDQRRRIDLSTSRMQAGALADRGEFDGAVKVWTRILADWGDIAAHHAGLAAALDGLGQVERAAEHYEKALTLEADTAVYRDLVAFYERHGRSDAAAGTRSRLARARQAAFGLGTAPATP